MGEKLFTEDFRTEPYWWEKTPPADSREVALPEQADVAVIGSGYTGLNAALVTARGGRHTVVLEAETPGWGCSTRNGGQISTSTKPSFEDLAARHGEARARAIIEEGQKALAWIESFIAAEGIDCDFKVPGRFHAAHNPVQFDKLAARLRRQPKGLEVPYILVPREEQQRELGTEAYFGGVVYPKHASLDPARFHRGLLARAESAGVAIVPCCRVEGIEPDGGGFRLRTGRGSLRARDVVVATNGYTGSLTPWQRRRVIPIGSYMIATEPLPPELMARLMPTDRVVSDSRKVVYYYRPSPDRRRILFGGRVSFSETDPRVSGPRLHRELVRLFPELASARISHSWLGFVAYTFDTLAHLGRQDGLYYAMGYCGSGVSMASYFGMRIGQQVLGVPEGRCGYDGLAFETRPLYSGDPWFLSASVMFYRWLDSLNR